MSDIQCECCENWFDEGAIEEWNGKEFCKWCIADMLDDDAMGIDRYGYDTLEEKWL